MEDVRLGRVTSGAVRACERGLAALVGTLDPAEVRFSDASELWAAFDRIERLAANAKTLLAARVDDAGEVEAGGGALGGGASREDRWDDDE